MLGQGRPYLDEGEGRVAIRRHRWDGDRFRFGLTRFEGDA